MRTSVWIARNPRLWPAAILLVALSLALGGCTIDLNSIIGTAPQSNGPAPTPTATATPAPTPTTRQACQALLGSANVQAATAITGFADVRVPPDSLATSVASSHGGDGRYGIEQFDVCAPASSAGAVRSFFTTGLASAGWAPSATYPYDGGYQAPCGDPYCWSKDQTPRYVSLESVSDRASGFVTYHVRLAAPPTPPACQPDSYGIYATRPYDTALPNSPAIPAPPLTKDGIGSFGTSGTVTEGGYAGMCSAGSASALTAFFTTELPHLGWASSDSPAYLTPCHMSGTLFWKDHDIIQWSANGGAGASGTFWTFTLCHVAS